MPPTGVDEQSVTVGRARTVHGRAAESAALADLLLSARKGESRALVIRGDAGVGKSALLDLIAERAVGMTALKVRATATEVDLAFGGLFGLLRPILHKLDQVADPQARALAGAFGLAEGRSPDRFLVAAGALGLLAAAAEDAPLCCIVDDAQWLDRSSAETLVFVARRLRADAVALLFAASDWAGRYFEAPDVPELILTGVDRQSAARILEETAGKLAPHVRERLLTEAAGNPLALRELAIGLSDDERAGRDPLPEPITLTPRLHRMFERRIERLPADAQEALLICALDGTGDLNVIVHVCELLDIAPDCLRSAAEARLVKIVRSNVTFEHPLIRCALTASNPPARQRQVHAAFAETLTAAVHLDRRIWHRAMAAKPGDEGVAGALEQSARRTRERGGHATASIAYERAAELSLDETRLGPRLAAAAAAAWDAGQTGRARGLADRAFAYAPAGALRAELLHLRGRIDSAEGRYRDAGPTLLAAARESVDPSLTLAISVDIVYSAIGAGLPRELVISLANDAEPIAPVTRIDEFNKHVVLWLGRQSEEDFASAQQHLEQALALADGLETDPWAQYWAGVLAGFTFGNGVLALPYARRAVEAARSQGRMALLPELLAALALQLCWNSQFAAAYAAASEGEQLARLLGQNAALNLLTLACVEAVRGQSESARAHALEAREHSFVGMERAAAGVLGLLELGDGRPEVAAEILLGALPSQRLDSIGWMTVPDLIEALVRTGRSGECHALLEWLRHTKAMTEGFRSSLVARCEALLEIRQPGEAFEEALKHADALPPFEHARTALLYGEWLRRQRRRKQARPHLRSAAEAFRRLGAPPWALRAEAELRATGETARRRDPSSVEELTPQEHQIAGLVADGLTNREIAAQLFLSPRTIDYHLRKVFSKLGISARSELIRQRP